MKLKAGETYWSAVNRQPPAYYPRLKRNLGCDVAVIGAGITGALVAHQLIAAGLQVVMMDKRVPGTGSTSASTALLLYETDASLAELIRWHGKKSAIRAYRLGRLAIRQIRRIAKSVRADCGFRWRKSLYLASDGAGLTRLATEHKLRRRAGIPGAFLTAAQLKDRFGLRFAGALCSPGSAEIDAMRLTQALLAHHQRRKRLRVFQRTRVLGLNPVTDGVEVRTENGHIVRAKQVIVATGYEAAPFLKSGLVKLQSTYVVGSQPLPAGTLWREECLMWETARPYFYLRTTVDHRILMGGEDEPFAHVLRQEAGRRRKARKLLGRFRQIFPQIPFELKFSWAGTFGESPDGLPYIGTRAGSPRVWFALGYGGNGITFSQIAATILRRLCQGQTCRDAKIFRFDRINRHRGRTGSSAKKKATRR